MRRATAVAVRFAAAAALALSAVAGEGEAGPEPTPEVGRGPNHRAGAPFRAKLSPPFAAGRVIVIRGHVRAAGSGQALGGVVLDAFHADDSGNYDMQGYDYRARLITDEQGAFEFETVRPRGYSGLGAHIHFVISHPGYRTLNTELRFDDGRADSARADFPAPLVTRLIERTANGNRYEEGTFEVVLAPSG
jgi:protocatechuate 3,4-dioxygenase beta subunit